jgi:hypothetical protein
VKRNLKIIVLIFILLVGLVASAFFAIFIAGKLYRWYNPYLDQELAGTTTTASQWLEIVPQSPLRVERQRQMIALDLDKSIHTEREGSGLVLPDGSIVRPQVQLVAKDGKIYELNRPSFFLSNTGEILAYFSRADLPNDQTYIKVRIRSDRPVRCNRIIWRNYNLWDAESPF